MAHSRGVNVCRPANAIIPFNSDSVGILVVFDYPGISDY